VKKLQISFDDDQNEFQLFGINTHLEDYQLAAFVNEEIDIKLSLLYEHQILNEFTLFIDQINEKKIILLQNSNSRKQIAFEKLKSFDYLMIFSDNNNEKIVDSFQGKEIFYTNQIETSFLKEKDIQTINQLFLLINSKK